MPDKKTVLGIALGVAGTLAAPVAAPAIIGAARPIIKAIVKHALLGASLVREKVAVALEELDDIIAEAKIEVSDELAEKGAPGPRAAEPPFEGPPSNGEGRRDRPSGKHIRGVVS